MEPILGSIFILIIGLGYLKHVISKNCFTREREPIIIQTNTIEELPPKYEDIDNPPNYSIV